MVLQTEEEVERLTKQKASRMKELVLKRRVELENICRNAHMEPDTNTAPEKIVALIDSGIYPADLFSLAHTYDLLNAPAEYLERS